MKEFTTVPLEGIKRNALYGAFAVALVAMSGSLFYSQILHLPPCILCWFQRICMYPLVIVLGAAVYKRSRDIVWPGIILACIGWIISLYHNLLYYKILPEAVAPCQAGISCTTKWPGWLSSFPIPTQALVGFTLIIILLIIYLKSTNETQNNDQRS